MPRNPSHTAVPAVSSFCSSRLTRPSRSMLLFLSRLSGLHQANRSCGIFSSSLFSSRWSRQPGPLRGLPGVESVHGAGSGRVSAAVPGRAGAGLRQGVQQRAVRARRLLQGKGCAGEPQERLCHASGNQHGQLRKGCSLRSELFSVVTVHHMSAK